MFVMDGVTRRLLLDLRALIAAEVPRQTNSFIPRDRKERNYGSRVGLPFTPQFKRYIGHPDGWGKTRMGTASILEVDAWCRQRHAGHDRGPGKRPVCAKLLMDAAYWGQEAPVELEPLLGPALRHALQWRGEQNRPRLEEPLPNSPLPRRAERGKVARDGQRHRRQGHTGLYTGREGLRRTVG